MTGKRTALLITGAAWLLMACLLLSSAALGQQVTASITGRVTDASGAGIPGAKITAVDVERGTQATATANSEGFYTLSNVPVGTYNLKVENPGFQTATQTNVLLQLNQVARWDVALQVGNVATSVEVTGSAPLLQTESTLLGQVIDARTNATLPLATRNYVQLDAC